jgi:hypothetical protein
MEASLSAARAVLPYRRAGFLNYGPRPGQSHLNFDRKMKGRGFTGWEIIESSAVLYQETTSQAKEEVLHLVEMLEMRTAGAEARADSTALTARLKSCPDTSGSPG